MLRATHDIRQLPEYTPSMLHRLRKHLPSVTRLMLGVVGGVWLTAAAAPCVMAAPCVHHSEHPCHESSGAPSDHGPACPASGGVDCQLPTSYSPAAFDLADYLLVLPAAAVPRLPELQTAAHAPPAGALQAWQIPAPPLYLRNLSLLL